MGLLSSVMGRVSNAFGGLGGGQAGNTANMLSDLDSKYGTSVLGFINNPAVVTPTGMVDSATMLKQINQQAGVQDASGMLSGTGLPSLATPPQPAYSELGQQMLDSYSGLVEPVSAGMSDYEKQMNAIRSGMLDSRVIR